MMTAVPMRFADAPLLWTIDDVYSAAECRRIAETIERADPALATNNPAYRDQDRVIVDDAAAATTLFERLRAHLPERVGTLSLHGINPRLRYYRYRAGQRFEPHMDHWYQPDARTITLFTVLAYLNDGFEGGETRFLEQLDDLIRPRAGRVAIFQHKLRHEGCPVVRGTKYAMRTDVLYRAPSDIELTYA
jgi:hypothetical protein